jgi:protease PrsW
VTHAHAAQPTSSRTAGAVGIVLTITMISVAAAVSMWQDDLSLPLQVAGVVWVSISLAFWAVYGLVLLLILRRPMGRARLLPAAAVLALAWGVACADIVGRANGAVTTIAINTSATADGSWTMYAFAPVMEETLKTLGIVLLALLPAARRFGPAAGLAVGALVGVSFQVVENVVYTLLGMLDAPDQPGAVLLQVAFLRGVLGVFSHVVYSGVIGAAVGALVVSRAGAQARAWWLVVAAFAAMVGLHMLGNWAAHEQRALLYVASMGLGLVALVGVVRRVRRVDPPAPLT